MSKGKVLKLVLAVLLLVFAWRLCAPVYRFLSDSGMVIRWKLGQTLRSLPAPPEGVTLLARYETAEGGSDCSAFAIEEVYKADVSLESIVRYYETELAAIGWIELHGYDPQKHEYEIAAFERQKDEYMWLLSKEWLAFGLCPLDVELMLKQETQSQAVYFLHVGRTCQYASP